MRIQTILSMFPRLIWLVAQMFLIWITLGWKVRKTRKAFEKELIQHGISRRHAKQLSRQIKIAKDQMLNSLRKMAFS